MPDSLADRTLIYGSKEQCLERFERFAKCGCEEVILEPYWIEKERLVEAIASAGKIASELGGSRNK